MDLLRSKRVLIAIAVVGAMLLTADENDSGETSERLQQHTEEAQVPASTDSTANKDSSPEPKQTKTIATQATDLKPLELQERIRAHANIDLPQDI